MITAYQIALKISEYIEEIVQAEIAKVQVSNKFHFTYEDVMRELSYEIDETKDLITDFEQSRLTINRIEQEGYLRGLLTIYNRFKVYENDKE